MNDNVNKRHNDYIVRYTVHIQIVFELEHKYYGALHPKILNPQNAENPANRWRH